MSRGFARTFGQDLMRGEHVVGAAPRASGGTVTVKISAKMARLPFHGCDPDYIRDVCKARCCESSSAPQGTLIAIHPEETQAVEGLGGRVVDGLLQSDPVTRKCPFKSADHLCGIHFSGAKPFGCIASPFTLNANGTLIVRNRYRLLKCYNSGPKIPAYRAFRASLDLIFGPGEAARICDHLDAGGGDLTAAMPQRSYRMLVDNDEIKKHPPPDAAERPRASAKTTGGVLMASPTSADPEFYDKKRAWEREHGRQISTAEFLAEHYVAPDGSTVAATGTSIFDPVLCELVYRWFCPPGGLVFDPFAGGSVRGVVASALGRRYVGIDLRADQVEANRIQADEICREPRPVWHCGDSRDLASICGGIEADFLFSCPPYADLERYSDDPLDLSTLSYPDFRRDYSAIVAAAAERLRPNRFACFVVGDVRGSDGAYYGFPWHTIQAFEDAGLRLHNEAVLVTSVGSLPIRVGRQFEKSRKLGKSHQNVLVFVKGDARAATEACGPVDLSDEFLRDGGAAGDDDA